MDADKPMLVRHKGSDAMLDVQKPLAREDSNRLAKSRSADLKALRESDFAHKARAWLQMTGSNLLAKRIGDTFDENLSWRARAPDSL